MRQIQLTQRKIALVDDEDYDYLNRWNWFATRSRYTFYAMRATGYKQDRNTELMHRLILGLQPGDKRQCDHRDRNGLNNQRDNLRFCTQRQNSQSQRKKLGTSKYKGVCWHKATQKWRSQIRVKEKFKHLGSFNSELVAARAYDIAALKYHGDFALTNKMLGLLKEVKNG